PWPRHADLAQQVRFEIARQRDVLVHEGPNHPPHALVLHVAPVEIEHVAPVLAMDAHGHARQRGGNLSDESGEIARVDHLGTKALQQPPDLDVEPRDFAGRLMKGVALDVGATDAQAEIRVVRDADDGVAVALGRHVIDEVDEAVLHSARLEAVDDVRDQGSGPGRARDTGKGGLDGRHLGAVYYGQPPPTFSWRERSSWPSMGRRDLELASTLVPTTARPGPGRAHRALCPRSGCPRRGAALRVRH